MDNEILKEEQPETEQAEVLNVTNGESADSCQGSSENDTEEPIGKFKSKQALLDAYNCLQAEFTKKCQRLSELEKEKDFKQPLGQSEERLEKFFSENRDALDCKDEFKAFLNQEQKDDGELDGLWAKFILSKLSSNNDRYIEDPVVNKYLFKDENVRNKIIENYIKELNFKKPPVVMSNQSGQRVAEQKPATPSSLSEAKKLVEDMFS